MLLAHRTRLLSFLAICLLVVAPPISGQQPASVPASKTDLLHLITALQTKAKFLESSSGMRQAFRSFTTAHNLLPDSVRYSDFVMVRLVYEATRDAGLWNMHWTVTDQPPNSDRIWKQWQTVHTPSVTVPTAIAECDELSALYAFLVERAGVKSVGLLWPYPNHTVAVWMPRPANRPAPSPANAPANATANGQSKGPAKAASFPAIRVVVRTSQIFLTEADTFDTKRFDPWRQKTIYEYTRRDVSDNFEIPKPLFDFFLDQLDKYAGATDATLQQVRYLRESVFLKNLTPDQAAQEALRRQAAVSVSPEDHSAFQKFAADLHPSIPR